MSLLLYSSCKSNLFLSCTFGCVLFDPFFCEISVGGVHVCAQRVPSKVLEVL